MNHEAKKIIESIEQECVTSGISFVGYLSEMDAILRTRIRALLTPNILWFKEGKTFNRYWQFLEKVTARKWEYGDVDFWYKRLRDPSDTREEITPALRYQVLLRDKSTCQKCGRKAPKVELEIDHIFPWSLGGPTVLE